MHPSHCPVCQSTALSQTLEKYGVKYWSCQSCELLFVDDFDKSIIETHNDGPEVRANIENQSTRLKRVVTYLGRIPGRVLDFGCGLGTYVEFLKSNGIQAVGIDQDTELQIEHITPSTLDAINMVEVIEHISDPLHLIERLLKLLKPDGVLYLESSFVDFLKPLDRSPYINPKIGHICIQSRKSMNYMKEELSIELIWINNNTAILRRSEIPKQTMKSVWDLFNIFRR